MKERSKLKLKVTVGRSPYFIQNGTVLATITPFIHNKFSNKMFVSIFLVSVLLFSYKFNILNIHKRPKQSRRTTSAFCKQNYSSCPQQYTSIMFLYLWKLTRHSHNKQDGIAETLQTRLWEVDGMNLSWTPTIITEDFEVFLSPSMQMSDTLS
jgi:hypothetical protein